MRVVRRISSKERSSSRVEIARLTLDLGILSTFEALVKLPSSATFINILNKLRLIIVPFMEQYNSKKLSFATVTFLA